MDVLERIVVTPYNFLLVERGRMVSHLDEFPPGLGSGRLMTLRFGHRRGNGIR